MNDAFVINQEIKNKIISEDPKSLDLIKPFLIGRDVKRYEFEWSGKYLIFTRRGVNIHDYPAIYKYLLQFKEQLMPKPKNWSGGQWKGRKSGSYQWYEIQDSINYYKEFEKVKIIYPNICKRPEFSLDTEYFYTNQKCYIIPKDDKYLLGILNSKIMMFYFRTNIPKLRGDYYEPGFIYMKNFPVPIIDYDNPTEIRKRKNFIQLVEQMLELHKRTPQTPFEQELLKREIDATDAQIDRLVYDLYGLTEEEIKIVEGENN